MEERNKLKYGDLEYEVIINKWNELFYNSTLPTAQDALTRCYELARALRNICNNDTELLNKIIPTFEGMTDAMKAAQIAKAVNSPVTQMPQGLRTVLNALKDDYAHNEKVEKTISDIMEEDELLYFRLLPKKALAMGYRESALKVGEKNLMPMVVCVGTVLGGIATGVRLKVDGTYNWLNMLAYCAGAPGSNKSDIKELCDIWLTEVLAEDQVVLEKEAEWRKLFKKKRNDKNLPPEPELPLRYIPLNNTLANVVERLNNLDERHALSVTEESDEISAKWSAKELVEFSVYLRKAWDSERLLREAKSVDAARCYKEHLKWNVVLLGTDDALYRFVRNYNDGLQSRMAFGRMFDNTFAKKTYKTNLTERQRQNIRDVAHLLGVMKGDISLPKLQEKDDEWTEKIRLSALKCDDEVLANCRKRNHTTAQRIVCTMMLCSVAEKLLKKYGLEKAEGLIKDNPELLRRMMAKEQTEEMLAAYDVIADYLVDNDIYFFRSKLTKAYEQNRNERGGDSKRQRRGKNDTIFDMLPQNFSRADAMKMAARVKGESVTDNTIAKMLYNWKNSGLVTMEGELFKKNSLSCQ
ncbi:MAG: hypothetical protein MR717_01895 [Prevotella sp.]|nr:hypothetical protein [Prevotella sp.]